MALRKIRWHAVSLFAESGGCRRRLYATTSKFDLRKFRSMILEKIENRGQAYPVRTTVPVAKEVLLARNVVIHGVSTLINYFPLRSCKFCPEIYIGEQGHLIRTCRGYRHRATDRVHEWVEGGFNDILVPVETFHLQNMFQSVIRHNQRFDFDRLPAVVELCWQAGADPNDENLSSSNCNSEAANGSVHRTESLSPNDLASIANQTLEAWETLRSGVEKLLKVYSVKFCKHCNEVHIGPPHHKARVCGVFTYEGQEGAHFWMKANVDNLVPPKIVWRRRPQDPPVLLNEGRDFYGRVPAIVELCLKAGAKVPAKYNIMIKVQGFSGPANNTILQGH